MNRAQEIVAITRGIEARLAAKIEQEVNQELSALAAATGLDISSAEIVLVEAAGNDDDAPQKVLKAINIHCDLPWEDEF